MAMEDAEEEIADRKAEEERCLQVFQQFDLNQDGSVTQDELGKVLQMVDPVVWTAERVKALMQAADTDKSGSLDCMEFVAWLLSGDSQWSEARDMALLNATRTRGAGALSKDSRDSIKVNFVAMQIITNKQTRLGIKIDNSDPNAIIIKTIQPDGLFAEWNGSHRLRQVSPGDRIATVNDLTAPKDVLRELRTFGTLDIGIQPREGAVQYESKISDAYSVEEGSMEDGRKATIRRAKHIATDEIVAVRSIFKKGLSRERLDTEISALRDLDHPNIIRLFDIYEDFLECHLVMQICTGGELFERILMETSFSERHAGPVMQQLVSAVAYMHSKYISHRDLKPENMLLEDRSDLERATIRIIDWHSVGRFTDGRKFSTLVGSVEFSAPEIRLSPSYDHTCDIWSCGCILYFMLGGYPPFYGDTDHATLQEVRKSSLCFHDEDFGNVSAEAKDLIVKLLSHRPVGRPTAEQAANHSWMDSHGAHVTDKPLHEELGRMQEYVKHSKFKKQVLHSIAHHLSGAAIQSLSNIFTLLDTNKDGSITLPELKQGLDKWERTAEAAKLGDGLRSLFENVDSNGNKRIDYTEFIAATLTARHCKEENVLWAAFNQFDHDHSGRISQKELAVVMQGEDLPEQLMGDFADEVRKAMQDFDDNGDGEIDFHEFMEMMRGNEPVYESF